MSLQPSKLQNVLDFKHINMIKYDNTTRTYEYTRNPADSL